MGGPAESEELPQANVKRTVKAKLAELAKAYSDDETWRDVPVNKEALLAFAESAKIFIHYLSATANDICRESRRQTINADDVLKALEEIEFQEFVEPLKASLEEYRKENVSKKSDCKKKAAATKRKPEEKGDTTKIIPNGEVVGSMVADDEDKMDEDGIEENSSEE
ncbi:hypothetical protein O6H91_09G083000 [Diphasiastrum complanatum]|uniref:Uncharacterized protein n=1 Tax=Diphasiastrum complanatum TaxID=34168 RepID=A0ACC2CRJ8_DIPCM|nr:hypothetical protein O6H91_09G083000 [Diphasiastrum complanatum]